MSTAFSDFDDPAVRADPYRQWRGRLMMRRSENFVFGYPSPNPDHAPDMPDLPPCCNSCTAGTDVDVGDDSGCCLHCSFRYGSFFF